MLKLMRKHAKYFYVLFVLVILTFIFWGVGGVDKSENISIAVIGKERIGVEEYWRTFDRMSDIYRDVYKEQYDEKMQEQLKKTVLDSMIEERVLFIAAIESGIHVSDKEVSDAIINDSRFIREGAFNNEVYLNTLRLNGITPGYFESAKKRELMVDKMKRLITESVDLTPGETKGIEGTSELQEGLRKAVLEGKRAAAVKSFVDGMKSRLKVTVNTQLIG